jgi:outer membrane protein OmpA-like peptidoglycan-associated protein
MHMTFKRLSIFLTLFSFLFLVGCAGMEFAPKKGVWYYPKELVAADKAVAKAHKTGKDKRCPVEYRAAKDLTKMAYDTYLSCKTKEGIAVAMEARKKADALCPAHPKPLPKHAGKVIDKFTLTINFDFNKSQITKADQAELEKATEFLKKYPKAKIRLEGYTDSVGTKKYNLGLSKRRAAATKKYFVKEAGVAAKRISTVGYGESNPIASNKTSEGRAMNRRVEILILGD